MTPSAMLSPYEPEYRDAARGWEQMRSTLASNLQALASPQAYASAGLPTSYWKKKSDERLGDLNAGVDAKRADIEARYRRGAINSAQRLQEMEDLERDAAQQRGQTAAGMDTARVEQGMQAVGQSAGILGSLYGNVPVASAPQMLPLSAGYNDILSAGGGLSGGRSAPEGEMTAAIRDAQSSFGTAAKMKDLAPETYKTFKNRLMNLAGGAK